MDLKSKKDKKNKMDYALVKKAKEQSITIVFFALIATIVITFNIVSTRIDLTRNNVYSISKVSRKLIKDIENPVYVDYYLSPSLKLRDPRAQQAIDLLEEYSVRSRGNVVFTKLDASDPEIKKEIEGYQLQGQQIQIFEQDQASFAVVYSGIVISYKDRNKTIPFLLDPSNLEYQITSKILQVYNDDESVAGILTLDGNINQQQDLQFLNQILEQDFTVKNVSRGEKIDEDIDTLFVIGGKDIDNDTAYYIDQFVMSGKGVFFAVDRASVQLHRGIDVALQDNLLLDMLDSYGVEVDSTIVADKLNKPIPLAQGNFQRLSPYALWVTIGQDNFNKEHPLTANFSGMDLYWTSPIIPKDNIKDIFTPLVKSSKEAWTIVATPGHPNPHVEEEEREDAPKRFNAMPDPTNFEAYKTNDNTAQYNLVGAVQGKITSAVEDNIITKPKDADDYIKSSDAARFIVIGNYNFLTGIIRATNAGYNLEFVSNSAEWLGSSEELLSIKSKAGRNIQLNKIQGDKFYTLARIVKFINIGLIPFLIGVFAIVLWVYRRRMSTRKY